MLPELKLIARVVLISMFVGGAFGILIAALGTEFFSLEFFLWVGGGVMMGAAVGPIFAYGFLPESGEAGQS